ncbi:MAG: hypothetical protein EBU90_00055 [Proteobacteria bacterium]|nr:hypothetical protein [Pseudomonadota bacterium]NBP12824.1 hypothetical protein [bacterium]
MNEEVTEHHYYISPEQYERLYKENQELKKLLNEAITLADTMSDEINQNWCKESKLAVAKLNLIIEKAGYKRA